MADNIDKIAIMSVFAKLVGYSVLLKLLLFPSYRSTDFEVHRNWLAVTHSLPISKWYYEIFGIKEKSSVLLGFFKCLRAATVVTEKDTSQWTLDYPPFFAWFEFILSQAASWVDPAMVNVRNLDYASTAAVVFQRLTVVTADMMLVYACYQYFLYYIGAPKENGMKSEPSLIHASERQKKALLIVILVVFNFGLIIVDHIHFQYNGFLFGMLILSVTRMLENEFLWSAFWFSVLLNFKHIYLYIAPAYFVYLLRSYCFRQHNDSSLKKLWCSVNLMDLLPFQLLKLGILVISVFAVSFGPFIAMGQIQQVLLRLFPFKRGLCHAYWAPNFWALYNVLDKLTTALATRLGIIDGENMRTASLTGGLIGHSHHHVLPSISPLATVLLTLLSMLPCLIKLWLKPCGPKGFLQAIVLCAFGSFLFGWHVHEKAVLLITIPLSLLSLDSVRYGRIFIIISAAGNMSLFPLLFQPSETPIKVILMFMYTSFSLWALRKVLSSRSTPNNDVAPLLCWYEKLYLVEMIVVQVYNSLIHHGLGLSDKLPFLPLLVTSCYCAIGVVWSWLLFYQTVLMEERAKIS